MKLWLQVLFAQGYLWRDRFPDAYAVTQIKGRLLGWWLFYPVVLVVLGGSRIPWGAAWLGVITLAAGALWVVWRVSALMLQRRITRRALVISIHWASGFMVFILLWLLVPASVAADDWGLALVSIALQVDPSSTWLWEVQNNYLLFRDPSRNQWRIDAHARTGWISPLMLIAGLAEAYILLPAKILGMRKTSRPAGGGTR